MRTIALLLLLVSIPTSSLAQDGYFSKWFDRVDKTQSEQPHWITPVATTTPRLEEEVRYDQLWQVNSAGVTTDNYGGGKGLELIPAEKVEVIFNVPPYLVHNNPKVQDGFGDVAFLVKYSLLSESEEHGNYILTAFLGWSVPTGQFKNGAPHAVITPTIAYGKGFHHFDAQGTFGIAIPIADTDLLGRNYLWNNTLQYHLLRKLWPEVEFDTTFFQLGPHDGMKQNFVTPGLVIGRLHVAKRLGLTFGGGVQIATTHFHTTNHNPIFTLRLPF
jgi:hypothetical protein